MRWLSLVLGLMLAFFAGSALAEEKPYEVSISVGASGNDYDDEASRAAEYESRVEKDSTWYLSGEGRLEQGNLLLRFHGTYIDGDDQEYGLGLDWARYLGLKSKYHRFFHRLDHDRLENLLAHSFGHSGGGKENTNGASAYVTHTDLSLEEEFGITRSEWKNNIIFRLPSLPGLKVGFDYRYETRKGFDQARTLSKCSGCHVVAMTKQIAEFTNEYVPYLEARLGKWTFRYSFLYRNFGASSDVPTNLYLNAEGPGNDNGAGTINPSHGFESRLLYDYSSGELPFARTPDSEKWMHSFKAKWEPVSSQVWSFGLVASQNKNKSSNDAEGGLGILYGDAGEELEQEYSAFTGNWHWRINRRWSLTARAKLYDMDADDVTLNYVNVKGTTTYAPITQNDTPLDPNEFFTYNRESAYDEDGFSFNLDLAWRYSRALKFRFGYELEYEDRENAEAHDVTDDTTTHTFKLGATWRAMPGLKLKADYRFVYVDDPKLHLKAADPASALDPTPGDFTDNNADLEAGTYNRSYPPAPAWTESSIYEYLVYERRTKDLSAEPEYVHDFALKGDWGLTPYAALAFHGRFKWAENTETDGYDWEQNLISAGINLALTPSQKLAFNLGYEFFYDEYTAMMCSALYHG